MNTISTKILGVATRGIKPPANPGGFYLSHCGFDAECGRFVAE